MYRIILFLIIILINPKPFVSNADTVDVWVVHINSEIILNSNLVEILEGRPILLNISKYSDIDTVRIYYGTDTMMEMWEWTLLLKDSTNNLIKIRSNPIAPEGL